MKIEERESAFRGPCNFLAAVTASRFSPARIVRKALAKKNFPFLRKYD
jgi:hypothetical protein